MNKHGFALRGMAVLTLLCFASHGLDAKLSSESEPSSRTLTLSHSEYLDRVQAIWTAQMIGQMTGVRFRASHGIRAAGYSDDRARGLRSGR